MADPVDPLAAPSGTVRTDDWPVQATDAIVKVVGTAHDKITGPITTVARAVAYGVLAIILGTTVVVLFVIVAGRFLNVYLPDAIFGENHMWTADLILGLPFLGVGIYCFRRSVHGTEHHPA
jgi:hypothetical protein